MPKEVHEQLSFSSYIPKILSKLYPDITIAKTALSELNLMIHLLGERIAYRAASLQKSNFKITINTRAIQSSIRLCLPPGELANQSVYEGTKAVTKYIGSREDKIKRNAASGLIFPVSRVAALIRYNSTGAANRSSATAAVYLAAALEYITSEILDAASNAAHTNNTKRITTRHLQLAIRGDDELDKLFDNVTNSGGVIPFVHPALV